MYLEILLVSSFCSIINLSMSTTGTSLTVQWLTPLDHRLPMQGLQVQSLVRSLVRSHVPYGQKTKT